MEHRTCSPMMACSPHLFTVFIFFVVFFNPSTPQHLTQVKLVHIFLMYLKFYTHVLFFFHASVLRSLFPEPIYGTRSPPSGQLGNGFWFCVEVICVEWSRGWHNHPYWAWRRQTKHRVKCWSSILARAVWSAALERQASLYARGDS